MALPTPPTRVCDIAELSRIFPGKQSLYDFLFQTRVLPLRTCSCITLRYMIQLVQTPCPVYCMQRADMKIYHARKHRRNIDTLHIT